ncbi:MAG: hypothetical protein AABZ13_01860 [Planctomycetota bacterium]
MKNNTDVAIPKNILGSSHLPCTKLPITARRAIPLLMSYKYFAVLSLCFLVIGHIITRKEGMQKAKTGKKDLTWR